MPIPSSASNSPWATLLPVALAGTGRQPFAPLPSLTPNLGAEAGAAAGQPPRVRVELPTARNPTWEKADLSTFSYSFRSGELAACLQGLLCALGPRYWATAWQLPPA